MQKSYKRVNPHTVSDKLESRINYFAENKVNHFSPTISPAPKDPANNEIESIAEALAYFAKNGVTQAVIQPKYMGSYCDIYLHKNLENTYFVSRNGHLIRHIDLDLAKAQCQDLHQKMEKEWADGASLIIVQVELMPWTALGKGLVEREFRGYSHSHRVHHNFLAQSEIYKKVAAVKETAEFQAFAKDYNILTIKELREKYKIHVARQYESLMQLQVLDLPTYTSDIELYETQLEHYGKESELHFKPFNVLKIIYENGKESINNDNQKGFEKVSNDTQVLVNLQDMEAAKATAYGFFHQLVAENYEGVMIKPLACFSPNLPPAFKVRNNHYLQMIYGINFRKDYDYYLSKRNIRRKMECSINDWAISAEMLKVPHRSLDTENYLIKLLCYKRIMQEEIEGGLDTRL